MKSGTFPSLKRTSTLAATRSALFHNTLSISVNEAWASFRDILQRFIYKDASLISKKVKGRLCPSLTPDVKKGMVFSEKPTKLLKKTIGLLLNGNAAEYPALLKKNVKADIIEIFLKIVLPLQIYFGQPPRNSILLYWVDWVVSIPFSMPSFSSNSCNCRDNHIISLSINRIFIVYDQIISLPFEKVNSVAFLTLVNTLFLLYILSYSFVYRSFIHQGISISVYHHLQEGDTIWDNVSTSDVIVPYSPHESF